MLHRHAHVVARHRLRHPQCCKSVPSSRQAVATARTSEMRPGEPSTAIAARPVRHRKLTSAPMPPSNPRHAPRSRTPPTVNANTRFFRSTAAPSTTVSVCKREVSTCTASNRPYRVFPSACRAPSTNTALRSPCSVLFRPYAAVTDEMAMPFFRVQDAEAVERTMWPGSSCSASLSRPLDAWTSGSRRARPARTRMTCASRFPGTEDAHGRHRSRLTTTGRKRSTASRGCFRCPVRAWASWLDGRQMKEGAHEGIDARNMSLRGAMFAPDGNQASEMAIDDRVCECCRGLWYHRDGLRHRHR
jgi:hypothetical protein